MLKNDTRDNSNEQTSTGARRTGLTEHLLPPPIRNNSSTNNENSIRSGRSADRLVDGVMSDRCVAAQLMMRLAADTDSR